MGSKPAMLFEQKFSASPKAGICAVSSIWLMRRSILRSFRRFVLAALVDFTGLTRREANGGAEQRKIEPCRAWSSSHSCPLAAAGRTKHRPVFSIKHSALQASPVSGNGNAFVAPT